MCTAYDGTSAKNIISKFLPVFLTTWLGTSCFCLSITLTKGVFTFNLIFASTLSFLLYCVGFDTEIATAFSGIQEVSIFLERA